MPTRKFESYTELELAVSNDEASFVRVLQECKEENPESTDTKKFLIKFLKKVFEPSLLHRLHPTGSHVNEMSLYKYGNKYYEFPEKLLAVIVAFAEGNFPLPQSHSVRIKQSIDVCLSNWRKIRASQMRAYISTMAQSNLHGHPLFYAVAWDTHSGSGIFRSPAPIWPGSTVDEKDNYLASYQVEWSVAAAGLVEWETNLPPRWDATPSRFGVPPIPTE